MIELLYEVNNVNTFKQSIKKLENKCDDLRGNYDRVSSINDQLKTENSTLKITNKRLRDDGDINDRELKKLKTEKIALLDDNRVLQTTVNNLRSSMRK
jgi:ABC-type phosphate transport system auxiliary subunit